MPLVGFEPLNSVFKRPKTVGDFKCRAAMLGIRSDVCEIGNKLDTGTVQATCFNKVQFNLRADYYEHMPEGRTNAIPSTELTEVTSR